MKFNDWINYVKSVGGVDTDGYYGKQCMDLYNHYCNKVLGVKDVGCAMAKLITQQDNVKKNFKIVNNYGNYIPPKGSIAVWQGFEYGHVAIVKEANINTFKTIEQNWRGDRKLTEEEHNYTYGLPLYFLEPINRVNIDESARTNKKIHLPKSVESWRVYPLSKSPVVGNECGKLLPAKFGGLDYDVIRWISKDVAVIQTRDFGKVQIYVGKDTDAVIK